MQSVINKLFVEIQKLNEELKNQRVSNASNFSENEKKINNIQNAFTENIVATKTEFEEKIDSIREEHRSIREEIDNIKANIINIDEENSNSKRQIQEQIDELTNNLSANSNELTVQINSLQTQLNQSFAGLLADIMDIRYLIDINANFIVFFFWIMSYFYKHLIKFIFYQN